MAKKTEVVKPQVFRGSKRERLEQLYGQWYGCQRCVLASFRREANGADFPDIVFGEGNPDARIMIVGEAPGEDEEGCGVPFVGASGKLLNQILAITAADEGIQELYRWYNTSRHTPENQAHFHDKMFEWRHQEFFFTNIVCCRPPNNRTPTHPESKACWQRLLDTIDIVDPWFIIAAGKAAIEAIAHKNVEITKKRGSLFDVEFQGHLITYRRPVLATLHPSYLLRVADYKNKNGTFMQTVRDYLWAMRYVDGLAHRHFGTPVPSRPDVT